MNDVKVGVYAGDAVQFMEGTAPRLDDDVVIRFFRGTNSRGLPSALEVSWDKDRGALMIRSSEGPMNIEPAVSNAILVRSPK